MSESSAQTRQTRFATISSGAGTPSKAPDGNERKGTKSAPRLYHTLRSLGLAASNVEPVKSRWDHPFHGSLHRKAMDII